jgi:hypothetical protein
VKLKDILQTPRAIHRVRLALLNVPPDPGPERVQAATPNGEAVFCVQSHVDVGLRVLLGRETERVLECAQAYAERHKARRADPGDPLYDYGLRLYTVALSAVDPDSDPKDPDPFFGTKGDLESAVEEILSSPFIGRDGVLYLSEQQEYWQDALNPSPLKVSPERLYELVVEVATSKDARPFWELRPGMQWVLARFMAGQLLSSPDQRFFSGASSPESSSNSNEPNKPES